LSSVSAELRQAYKIYLILSFQIILMFFMPPLQLGARKLFAIDLALVAWLLFLFFQLTKMRVKLPWKSLLGMAALIVGIYLHGMFRPEIARHVAPLGMGVEENADIFYPGRELVIALRFISWATVGVLASLWFSKATIDAGFSILSRVTKVAVGCSAVTVVLMLLSEVSPLFRNNLAHFYLYDPSFIHWFWRQYGSFQSPLEAGTTLVLVALLSVVIYRMGQSLNKKIFSLKWTLAAIVSAILGLMLARTFTPLAASIGAMGLFFIDRMLERRISKPTLRWFLITLAGVLLCYLSFIAAQLVFTKYNIFDVEGGIHQKLANLVTRTDIWQRLTRSMLSRWDVLFFGFGFASYYSDSSYFFIFTRGGLFAVFLLLLLVHRYIALSWKQLDSSTKFLLIYFAVAGITLDLWIYRTNVALMVLLGVPLLSLRNRREGALVV